MTDFEPDFKKKLTDIKALFKDFNINFDVESMTVKEIIERLGKSNELYLKRYI